MAIDYWDYAEDQADALEMITEVGLPSVIQRETPGTGPVFDPGDPVTTSYPCLAVLLDIQMKDVDGTLIKASDQTAYVAASGLAIEPTTTDRLVFNGKSYTIVKVAPLQPAELAVYFKLFVRN